MKQKRILKDVRVKAMALTGSPANGEPFLLFKSKDAGKWPDGVEMVDQTELAKAQPKNEESPELREAPEHIAKAIAGVAQENGEDEGSQLMLKSIGHLMQSVPGLTKETILDLAKASGVDVEKAVKPKDDDDDEEDYDEDEDGDDDEDDDGDEDGDDADGGHPSLPPAIDKKAKARAAAKKQMKKSQKPAAEPAQEGGAMAADIEKSERVALAKAHKELLAKHEEMVADLKKTQAELHEQRDAAIFKSIQEEVVRDYPHLHINRDELAKLLKSQREQVSQENHASLVKMLKSLNAQAEQAQGGNLFRSHARTPAMSVSTGDGTAMDRFNALLEEKMSKSTDSKKSKQDHFLELAKSEQGRALWAESMQGGRN